MKTCPQCGKTFPDSEQFCEADGSALGSPSAPGSAAGSAQLECPVCGGKAEPGEVICNYCGARLGAKTGPARPSGQERAPSGPAVVRRPTTRAAAPTELSFDEQAPAGEDQGRNIFGTIGYVIAALVALAGGAWLAIHLSSGETRLPVATATATPSPAAASSPAVATGPLVALAEKIAVQVTGESAAAPERDQSAARKVFGDNDAALLDLYKRSLAIDSSVHDGMSVKLQVMPGGEVTEAKVMVSTALNLTLDADTLRTMMGWRFGPFGGSAVEVEYPIIFARSDAERADIETALADKLKSLSPSGGAEFSLSIPTAVPTSVLPTPMLTALPPPPPEELPSPRPTRKRSTPTPKPSVRTLVQNRLREEKKFSRVKFYNNGGVITLYGKVFDDNAKRAVERAVRGISAVTDVIDTLTTDKEEWAENEAKINRQLQNAGLGKVTATVIGRDAYLKGEVTTDAEKQRAVTITEGAAPVTVRVNLIRVVPGGIF